MNSTSSSNTTEPDADLAARADQRLAHAYEQIARADEQLVRVTEKLSKLEYDTPRHPSPVPGSRRSADRPALRGLIGLVLAACIVVAAFAWQSPYSHAAKLIIAQLAPQLVPTSALPQQKPGPTAQPSPSTVQVAAAQPTPSQATSLAQTAPQGVAPTAAPTPPELAQLLQTMARDLTNVEQGIEQLKASQQQMASDNAKAVDGLKASQEQITSDNAKAVDELKASQEQLTRLISKASEQNLRLKTSPPSPQPIAAPARKPMPTPLPQARAQPQAPMHLQSQEH